VPQPLTDHEIAAYRDRLTAAALELFGERGYDGVTLRSIAEALGCSPMTPYRYFANKDAIFAAVRTAAYDRFAAAQEAAVASTEDLIGRLGALGAAYFRFAREEPQAYRLMFGLSQPDPDAYPELRRAEQRAWAPLRAALAGAIEAGLLEGDPDTVAHVFWAATHGLVSLHLAGKLARGRTFEDLLAPIQRTLVRGNLATPEEPT
jgi:AcrR family transcriptional regulator